MDRSQIINLLINAVLTIVTTAIVTRLSLKKGRLDIAGKVRARFTPKFTAYMLLVLCTIVLLYVLISIYNFATDPASPTRVEILFIIFQVFIGYIWIGATVTIIKYIRLLNREEKERAQSDLPKKS